MKKRHKEWEKARNMNTKKHPTFRSTITKSKEWRDWEKVALKKGWDWAESTECGWLSPEHFTAFLDFLEKKRN